MPDPAGPKRVGALGGAVASMIGSLGKSRNGPVLMVPPVPKRSPPAPPLPWPAPPVFAVAPEEEVPVSPPPPQEAAAMTGAEHAETRRTKRREALFMGPHPSKTGFLASSVPSRRRQLRQSAASRHAARLGHHLSDRRFVPLARPS